ncbi:hypothetical protein GCM10028794_16870 [Silanimonas algicola]
MDTDKVAAAGHGAITRSKHGDFEIRGAAPRGWRRGRAAAGKQCEAEDQCGGDPETHHCSVRVIVYAPSWSPFVPT